MDTDTSRKLFEALQESGLYTPEQLAAAEEAARVDDAQLPDRLLDLHVLTPYQNRRARLGRMHELFFGHYFILDKLGEGGMGKVYRAVKIPGGKMVALKMIRPQLMTNKTVVSRYMREVQACADLEHPNIVGLLDADEINGRHFLAMEYVDGIDLSRLVKEFGRPPESGLAQYQEACEYIRQAALGLQHAHDRKYVHRDIKPSNILVQGDRALPGTSGKAVVKILDMGLIRSTLEDVDGDKTELTRDGTVVGTPEYMAPEQAKNSSSVDARADLYSLGCTLYFLFKGQSPFPNGSPIEKLLCHQTEPPPDLRLIRPDIPEDLLRIMERLLKKKPDDRFSSAREVARALQPFTPQGEALSGSKSGRSSITTTPPPQLIATPAPGRSARSASATVRNDGSTAPAVQTTAPGTQAPITPALPMRIARAKLIGQPSPNQPNSDSFPSFHGEQETVGAPPPTTEEIRPRSSELRRSSKVLGLREPPKKGIPAWVIILGSVFGTLVLIGVGLVIANGHKPSNSSAVSTETRPTNQTASTEGSPTTSSNPTSKTPPTTKVTPPTEVKLESALDWLTDRTNGALIVHPQPFWDRLDHDKLEQNIIVRHCEKLFQNTLFDPRRFQRVTVSLWYTNSGETWIAVGDGSYVNNDLAKSLEEKKLKTVPIGGKPAFDFGPKSIPRYGSLLLEHSIYSVGDTEAMLGNLTDRLNAKRPPERVGPVVKSSIEYVDKLPSPPLLMFAAGESFRLPDGSSLKEHEVHSLRVIVRLVTHKGKKNDEFQFEMILTGKEKSKLHNFVNEWLGSYIPKKYIPLQPIGVALGKAETTPKQNGNEVELLVTGHFSWLDGRRALEGMLSPIHSP